MIEIAKGNILDADVAAMVNAVNYVGVMGKSASAYFMSNSAPHAQMLALTDWWPAGKPSRPQHNSA